MTFGKIDAHHHLWDPGRRDYPWMAGDALAPIRKPYDLADLTRHTAAAGVDRTVLVQTISSHAETLEFLTTASASGGLIAGVVGWLDLTAPDVADRLAELRAGPGGDLLVGVRHQVQDESDPEWLSRPDVRAGLRAIADAGLVYDLLVLVHQLPMAIQTVRDLPELRFVLDHAAKPSIAAGMIEPWATHLKTLSDEPNVSCKLSGLVTEASWTSWRPGDIAPYSARVLECFGPSRVMFGSDWPVCELAATYPQVVELAATVTAHLAPEERARIFTGTAIDWYGLA
ncbi:amidohydrolase family protein [Streptosporangiaceae bacterium NEAU-GS5]|nr:amidohydrolase family protein [Streptosporangiaceae bacterium NEAU-GS5]